MVFTRGHEERNGPANRIAASASLIAHAVLASLALHVSTLPDDPTSHDQQITSETPRLVWIPVAGAGGGGGGGGNRQPEPSRPLQIPGRDRMSVPTERSRSSQESQPPVQAPEPEPELLAFTSHLAAGQQTLAGTLSAQPSLSESQGSGANNGADSGDGTGIGPGRGAGLERGFDRGTGGEYFRVGNGVTGPRLVHDVRPAYTSEAMRARVEGVVRLECVVDTEGRVGAIKLLNSVDDEFGLDEEAIKAARQWRFIPGQRQGKPVAVLVTIELAFSLR